MNLQQLKYIVAINRFRNFAKAADSCNISQPTLSAMLLKLEEELDVRIFDRTNKQVTPTSAGEKIILQAKKTLLELEKITELVAEEKNQIGKSLSLSVGPSIAPYILPKFIKHYRKDYPEVNLSIQEMKSEEMFHVLQDGEIDAGIAISDLPRKGILEIPLYTERFYVYLSEDCWRKLPVFKPENLEHENMWIMKEAQCLRDSAFSFCKARSKGHHIYESGSIETLIRIVDENGGFTIIPEMHLEFLNEAQRKNVRKIEGDYLSQRRISLYIREDYIKERMLNTIINSMKEFMPAQMMNEGNWKYGIRHLELNPGQLLPNSLERTMGVILEPEVGEEALHYHHGNTHKEGIGDAEFRLEIEAIISKQSTTDDRLEKVVGQTHLAKLAQERQSLSEPFLSVPQQYES